MPPPLTSVFRSRRWIGSRAQHQTVPAVQVQARPQVLMPHCCRRCPLCSATSPCQRWALPATPAPANHARQPRSATTLLAVAVDKGMHICIRLWLCVDPRPASEWTASWGRNLKHPHAARSHTAATCRGERLHIYSPLVIPWSFRGHILHRAEKRSNDSR